MTFLGQVTKRSCYCRAMVVCYRIIDSSILYTCACTCICEAWKSFFFFEISRTDNSEYDRICQSTFQTSYPQYKCMYQVWIQIIFVYWNCYPETNIWTSVRQMGGQQMDRDNNQQNVTSGWELRGEGGGGGKLKGSAS